MIEHIRAQASSMAKRGWTLSAVTVAALYDGRGMLKLWWQKDSFGADAEAADEMSSPRLESTRSLDWSEPAAAERAVLAAAAQCGAKTVSRIERSPLALNADPYVPGTGLVAAFANANNVEAPWLCRENFPEEVQLLIERAADEGWIMWLFDPARAGTQAGNGMLLASQARMPRHLRLAPFADRDHHHIYCLTRSAPRRPRASAGTRPYLESSSRAHALNARTSLR